MGGNNFVEISVGSFLILLGVTLITMLYIMRRARTIAANVEAEIVRIELEIGIEPGYFTRLNHPEGLSGRTFVSLFMGFLLGIITITGFCLIFGLYQGSIQGILFYIVCLLLLARGFTQEHRVKRASKRLISGKGIKQIPMSTKVRSNSTKRPTQNTELLTKLLASSSQSDPKK